MSQDAAGASPSRYATIDDVEVGGRRVLVRVDFNVPLKDGAIVDERRIRATVPTVESLRSRGARTLLVTHLGRPHGQPDDALRVAPLAARLGELIGAEVAVAADVVGDSARALAAALDDGEVGMLENVRFEPGEERNEPDLADRLASLAEVYVDDAFGTAHRAHASTEGVARRLPAVAGYLMARELEVLTRVLESPSRPLVAIIGGSKISTKIGVIENLLPRVETLWIGGAMACTFYCALGEATGTSLVEPEHVATASRLLERARAQDKALRLPVDVVAATSPAGGGESEVVSWKEIPAERAAVDVGPDTVAQIARDCAGAGTVVWNGPLGIYEVEEFAGGTRGVAQALVSSSAASVVGGGDLAAALDQLGLADDVGFVSTGGGATLEFLEGRTLPGVAVLLQRGEVRSP